MSAAIWDMLIIWRPKGVFKQDLWIHFEMYWASLLTYSQSFVQDWLFSVGFWLEASRGRKTER
jgi:hypothetical protein